MKLPALACSVTASFAHLVSLHCKNSTSSPWPASTFPLKSARHNDQQLWKLLSLAAFQKDPHILNKGFILSRQLLLSYKILKSFKNL